jgi:nicotinate-nucleotide adenylyltransferase
MPARLAASFRQTADGWEHASGNALRRLELTPLSISASDIRRRIATGASLRYLVPDEVIEYIQKHRLYERASDDEQGASSQRGSTR